MGWTPSPFPLPQGEGEDLGWATAPSLSPNVGTYPPRNFSIQVL
jgi:hypothetical protein